MERLLHKNKNTLHPKTYSRKMKQKNEVDLDQFDRYRNLLSAFESQLKCSKMRTRSFSSEGRRQELFNRNPQEYLEERPMSVQSIRSNIKKMQHRVEQANNDDHKMVASKSEMLSILKKVIDENEAKLLMPPPQKQPPKVSSSPVRRQHKPQKRVVYLEQSEQLLKQQTTPSQFITSFRVNSNQSFSPYNVLQNPIYSGSPAQFEAFKRRYGQRQSDKKIRIAIPLKQYYNAEIGGSPVASMRPLSP